jgi:signal transduction histidine kinase
MDIKQIDLTNPSEVTIKLCQQQTRELAILKAIIQTVSTSYNLKETLAAALEIVLSVAGSSVGWICLMGEDKSCSAFVGYRGLCFSENNEVAKPCLVHCVCGKVRRTGDVVIIRHLNQGCPLLDQNEVDGQKISGHISIPLTTKSRVVGQLNIAFSAPELADQVDIDLLKTISPQLAVAVENAMLWEEVQGKENMHKELLKRVVTAQEEERRRISRELHDEMGQELTSLLVRLQVLDKMDKSPQSHDLIVGLEKTTSQMLSSIHDLAVELRPTVLDDLGLVPALTQYAKTCPEYLGIELDFEAIGFGSTRLPHEVETTLYRIIQESLTNVARHSGAGKASVLLKWGEKNLVVIIEDNGVGFDPKDMKTNSIHNKHLGLYGMEERVSLIGGKMTVESSPGKGTMLYLEIPNEIA